MAKIEYTEFIFLPDEEHSFGSSEVRGVGKVVFEAKNLNLVLLIGE